MSIKKQIQFLSILFGFLVFHAIADELNLSASEQAYLQQHQTLIMCVDPDWLPYEKLDTQGKHIGLVAEYMAIFQARLNVAFKAMQTKSWNDTQALYQQGKCDFVSALNKTAEREQYLAFTQPYIKSPAVLVLNEKNTHDTHLADLKGKKLAMVKGYVYDSKLRQQYPEINIVYLENMDAALQKVSSGEIDATLGPLFLTFALTQELGLDNLKIMGDAEYQDELRIGIKKDNAILAGIFDKAVSSLSSEDNAKVRKAWAEKRKN